MVAWVPLLGILAAPLAGPGLWDAISHNPYKCYRDLIVKNTTSGEFLTCGSLVAKHQRLQNSVPCFSWISHVSPSLVLETDKQGLDGLSAAEQSSGVVAECRSCCSGAYPWAPKTDM